MSARRTATCVTLALALLSTVANSQQNEPVKAALLGTWTWTTEHNCAETYTFREDDTLEVKSGDEITKNSYLIAAKASGNFERYRMDMKVLEDSGGRDCDNDTKSSVGETDIVFVQFSKSRDMVFMCQNPVSTFCYGPLRKAAP